MANEKIVNRENLKAFRQAYDERLKNGSLVPSKSLQAQSIQAVSVESGAIQETPFINQGTGTANGTDIVDTSPVGKHLEKQGNSVVVNQLIANGDFANGTTGWSGASYVSSFTVSNKVATIVTSSGATDNTFILKNNFTVPKGHKLLIHFKAKLSEYVAGSWIYCGAYQNASIFYYRIDLANANEREILDIVTTSNPITNGSFGVGIRNSNGTSITYTLKDVFCIDLTQWFNGDIPQDIIDNPSNFYRYYNGSLAYNAGTLVNADGQYLECGQSRNVWDEQWENGGINGTTGLPQGDANRIRSKNYNRCNPNTTYYGYFGTTGSLVLFFYDKDYNPVSNIVGVGVFTTPANAIWFKVRIGSSTVPVTTYGNNYTISLYYETGDGYDQYYHYVEPKVYDTGSEALRKAGSVKDYKAPDGTIHRLVGTYTFTGNETFIDMGTYGSFSGLTSIIGAKVQTLNILTSDGLTPLTSGVPTTQMSISFGSAINININSVGSGVKNYMTGKTIYYELDEPTTEQGTPFSENIEINDYSYMAWKNASDYVDVPQGCKIFYQADYVLFIDSVGQRPDINWDATKLVSQEQRTSDKNTLDSVDNQLKNAIGGTLRQCLCVKESLDFNNTDFVDLYTLNWSYSSASGDSGAFFYSGDLENLAQGESYYNVAKVLCSKYSSASEDDTTASTSTKDKVVSLITNGARLRIKDTTYTDLDTFKASLKNVLLAYEKAS